MKRNGGQQRITTSGFALPQQPELRRLAWLAVSCFLNSAGGEFVGVEIVIVDGSKQVITRLGCGGMTAGTLGSVDFLFGVGLVSSVVEDVVGSKVSITQALPSMFVLDASHVLTVGNFTGNIDNGSPMLLTWSFENED